MELHDEARLALEKSNALLAEMAAEAEEIQRHKWLESEKAGREISYEQALLDWLLNYRAAWKESRKQTQS